MYDICIVGGGPAGLTAAIYAIRAGKSCVLLEELVCGGQMGQLSRVDNMPCIPGVEGWDLALRLSQQVMDLEAEILYEGAESIESREDSVKVTTNAGNTVEAKRLILATGIYRSKLDVPGAEGLIGKGISTCAVCDGAFFKNKAVAVIGGGNSSMEDALYLSELSSQVFLLVKGDRLLGKDELRQQVLGKDNIQICSQTEITAVHGEGKVESVTLSTPEGARELPLSGIFTPVGVAPDTALYRDLVETESGFILTDENMRTSDPKIFAAGDIRKKQLRQIVTAMADGAIAAEQARKSL